MLLFCWGFDNIPYIEFVWVVVVCAVLLESNLALGYVGYGYGWVGGLTKVEKLALVTAMFSDGTFSWFLTNFLGLFSWQRHKLTKITFGPQNFLDQNNFV